MATSFQVDIWLDAPPGRVYEEITNIAEADRWMKNLLRTELLTEGTFAVGTRWREIRRMFGKEASEEFEVTECQPGNSFTVLVDGAKGSTGQGEFVFEHKLKDHQGGTALTIDATIKSTSWMGKIFSPLMKGAFRKAMINDLENFKTFIEE